jgi:Cu+-exporting ATPase
MEQSRREISEIFEIGGMSCAACAARIERVLRSTPGVLQADVNFATSRAMIRFDASITQAFDVAQQINKIGFSARAATQHRPTESSSAAETKVAILATILALPVAILGMSHGAMSWISESVSNYTQLILTTIIVVIAWSQFGTRALKAAAHFSADMNTLVFLGISAAYFSSVASMIVDAEHAHTLLYFEASGVTTAFVLIGRAVEARARRATGQAVREILESVPRRARRAADQVEIDAAMLHVGDHVSVLKGERFPADCRIVKGMAIIDESTLTGESELREADSGMRVSGGSVNHGEGVIAEVLNRPEDSLLPRIAAAVERLQSGKAPLSRLADSVSAKLTPIVLLISLGTFIAWFFIGDASWQTSLEYASSVLVVACPCALGLATPAALSAAAGAFAKRGFLFRDPASIETCARIDAAVFDKTGTLTTGDPQVRDVIVLNHGDDKHVHRLLSNASRASTHPLATAYARTSDHSVIEGDWKEIPGRGIEGVVHGESVLFGSRSLLRERQVAVVNADHFGPEVHLAVAGIHVATIRFTETLRPHAKEVINTLNDRGISTHILSGDRTESVRSIAEAIDCPNWRGELNPMHKVELLQQLKANKTVAFIGDGINDAPALAASDLGISMHGSTAAALESAGLTITHADLRAIPQAIEFSKKTVRTIRLNLMWAFAYNVIALPLAAGVLVPINGWKFNPMIASGAMALSSISVVLNSLRLRKM